MSRAAFDRLGFGLRGHRAALAYLALLYCRPARFHLSLEALALRGRAGVGVALALHGLPWSLLPALVLLVAQGDLARAAAPLPWAAVGVACALGLLVGAVAGVGQGLAVALLGSGAATSALAAPACASWFPAAIFCLAIGAASRLSGQPPMRGDGIALAILTGALLGSAPAEWVALGLLTLAMVHRAYLWPLHLVLVWFDLWRLYRWHPVAWDDVCDLPFPGFADLLIAHTQGAPAAGAAELARLFTAGQRWPEALRAHTAAVVRAASAETDLTRLPQRLAPLHTAACGDTAHRALLDEWIGQVARHQARLHATEQRPERVRQARLVHAALAALGEKLRALPEPLAQELEAALARWSARAQGEIDAALAAHARVRARLPRPFRAGDPVDRQREAFVPRDDVHAELRRQIQGDGACPGLLLYGRRRTGKSTILRNLGGYLPPHVRVVEASMQDPRCFTSSATLVQHLSERIGAALSPDGVRCELKSVDLLGFSRLLGEVDAALQGEQRLLLALDELESLDHKLAEGALEIDFLALLRDSLQSHRRVVWLLAGSKGLEELRLTDWSSYLVSARTLTVSMFSEAETHVLLTEPLAHSSLWAADDPNRPRFDVAFWGEHGPASIARETGGWPHLVQLLAECTVDLINDTGAGRVTLPLLQRAVTRAVASGDAVLAQLVEGECRLPGEWDYVRRFRTHEEQPPPEDDAVRRALRRRLLVEEHGDLWRLRVPLMRRWLRERG